MELQKNFQHFFNNRQSRIELIRDKNCKKPPHKQKKGMKTEKSTFISSIVRGNNPMVGAYMLRMTARVAVAVEEASK